MINGIVLGKKIWDVDVAYSNFWNPQKYGINFSIVVDNPNELLKLKNTKDYKFLLVSDVWTLSTRKVIRNISKQGLPIILLPRESFNVFDNLLFEDKVFLENGVCYYTPDLVLAPGTLYGNKWKDKTDVVITGHPRFDYCIDNSSWRPKEKVKKDLGIEQDKTIIFFPSYPVFHLHNVGSSRGDLNSWSDTFDEREETLRALLKFAKSRNDVQIVVKLHPSSSAIFKRRGITKDIEGITHEYLSKPTDYFKVIDGGKRTRFMARDILTMTDIVVGGNSTMMVEAALANKPVLRILFGKSKRIVKMPGYEDIFNTAYNEENLIKELSSLVLNMRVNYNKGNIYNYVYKADGNSCKRICDAIKEKVT